MSFTSPTVRPLRLIRAHVKRNAFDLVQIRTISHTASAHKAIAFSLNNLSHGSHQPESPTPYLRMIMFGKPGAGKGTLSARLVGKYDVLSLSTGDLLRGHIAEGTEVGRLAEGFMKKGELLPDEVVLKVVSSKLDALKHKHWILDGFPRTLGQGKLLDAHLREQNSPLSLIVNLDVPDQVILSRIADRWVHLPSGRVYNMNYNRPRIDGLDDETGEKLVKRPDDDEKVFATRLKLFYASTSPLLSYYSSSSSPAPLYTLKGVTSDEIWPQLDAVVKGTFPALEERAPKAESRETRRRPRASDTLLVEEGSSVGLRETAAAQK